MTEKRCDCCPLVINYERKEGKPANVIVAPFDLFKAASVQKAVHQCNVGVLPQACRSEECVGRCAAAAVIAEFQPNKK